MLDELDRMRLNNRLGHVDHHLFVTIVTCIRIITRPSMLLDYSAGKLVPAVSY